MNDDYLDAFVRESEEAITELNNSLLALESDPSDEEAMDRIFRTAHTLKGNFGAMGFEDASELAHAMEDLLGAMRDGEVAVTPAAMDPIFAAVDRLETIVGEIEAAGEPSTAADDTAAELRDLLEAPPADPDPGTDTGEETAATAEAATAGINPGAVDHRVARAEIDLGDTEMPGVDALLAIEAIGDAFDVLATEPDRAAIEDGAHGGTFSLFLDAADLGRVDAELAGIGEIGAAEVTDVTEAVRDGPTGAGEPADGPTDGAADQPDTDTGDSDADAGSVDEIKSVRVDVDRLDELHGLVEQLVTSRIKLRRAVEGGELEAAADTLDELDKTTGALQNTVMDMRLIPLGKVVGKFPRMVRDLARDLEKEIDFEIEGDEIELDRTILTEISDPLMHVIRNAVDHGIEPPAEREAAGKPRAGQVTLRAFRERDHVTIEVIDDGAGLDVEEIRAQAAEQGVREPAELEAMADSDVYDLVFHPGFSTAAEVTDVSGRGVGMDVVHDTVSRLDGSVNVESTHGEGTTVSLRLPVTMAIVKVLFVDVGEETYGVPIKHVDEITGTSDVRTVNGQEVIKHDDDIYPVIDLGEAFDVPARTAADGGNPGGQLIRIRGTERQVALRCDAVNAQEEVVVKPLEGLLSGTSGLSGTAVLGDGNIVHILDVVTV